MGNKLTMDDYIRQTPDIIRENVKNNKELTKTLVQEFLESDNDVIIFIACGSSYNACQCARPLMRKVLKKEVKVITPYTFEHYEHDLLDNAFVCVVSQSGCSTNAIRALKTLRQCHKKAIGITSNLKSDFADGICDVIIDYGIGIETVGYVTKGMVGLVLFLMLFALNVSLMKNTISQEVYDHYILELNESADVHEGIYKNTKQFFEDNKKALLSMDNAYMISSGPNYGCALEGALKIGETVKIPAIAYELEEYIHGPNLQLTPKYNVFFIDNNDSQSQHVVDIYEGTATVTDRTFIITNNPHVSGKTVIRSPKCLSAEISVLYNLATLEYIAYKVTESLQTWQLHPLADGVEMKVKSKTKKYKGE